MCSSQQKLRLMFIIKTKMYLVTLFLASVHGQDENENCPSHELAKICRQDCEGTYRECLDDCPTSDGEVDANCVVECSSQDIACVNHCPCYEDCPGGCPCDFDSDYCPAYQCEDTHGPAYRHCVEEMKTHFYECAYKCEAFDINCHEACAKAYSENLDTCPCMDKCADGCPCPNYECEVESNDRPDDHDDIHALVFNPYPTEATPTSQQIKLSVLDLDISMDESWVK